MLSAGLGGALGRYLAFERVGFMTDALSHAVAVRLRPSARPVRPDHRLGHVTAAVSGARP